MLVGFPELLIVLAGIVTASAILAVVYQFVRTAIASEHRSQNEKS